MIRLCYVHPAYQQESHRFWQIEFMNQSDYTLWVKTSGWTVRQIERWQPNHIHFGSRCSPRKQWMPIQKILKLREALPECVITTYRGGLEMEVEYCEKLNGIVDAAFGPTDSYKGMQWLPAPADPEFWKTSRPSQPLYPIIFVGRAYQGNRAERADLLKKVYDKYPLTVVGRGWQKHGIDTLPPTVKFESVRRYYGESWLGLNITSAKYGHVRKYWSNRLIHMMMSGLPCLTPYQPGIEDVFQDNIHCFIYRNEKELFKKLDFCLERENRQKVLNVGRAGQLLAARQFSAKEAVRRVLSVERRNGKIEAIKKGNFVRVSL